MCSTKSFFFVPISNFSGFLRTEKKKKGLVPSFILLAFVSSTHVAHSWFFPKKNKNYILFFFFRWSTPARWSPATSSWSTRSCAPASPRSRGANNTDFPARKAKRNSNSRNSISGNWTRPYLFLMVLLLLTFFFAHSKKKQRLSNHPFFPLLVNILGM